MKSLTTSRFTWAVALCLFLLAVISARADFFVSPGALYVSYTDSELSSETGFSVAAGATLDATDRHEVSLEVGQVDWKLERPISVPGLGTKGSGKNVPILANYRYYFSPAEAPFRIYAGASAGIMQRSGDVMFTGSGALYGGSASESAFTFGGTVGLTVRLGKSLAGDLGYRYWQSDSGDVATQFPGGGAGPTISFPSTSAHVLALALRINF